MIEKKITPTTIGKWAAGIIGLGVVLYLLWYFRFICICLFIAVILSLIGRPIMKFLSRISYKKISISTSIAAIITLLVEVLAVGLVLYLLVPLIISQATSFATIDFSRLGEYYAQPLAELNNFLVSYSLLPNNDNLDSFLMQQLSGFFNSIDLKSIAMGLVNVGSNLVMGLFIVLFATFFFLKDTHMVEHFIDNITPDRYLDEVHHIISNSRRLISRYFVGVFCEVVCMTILLSLGFYIAGFHSAILIAAICGSMVILPYIGVIIGGGIGLLILLTDTLAMNPSTDILAIILQFVLIFAIVKLVDDFVLQPLIYSKSVKAHPLEIFLIILMSGKVGGVLGMVLAIPAYTFFRIIAKEFFSKFKFIKAITKEID